MKGADRHFYIVPVGGETTVDFFEWRLVKGYLFSDFSVLYIPALAKESSIVTSAALALTRRDCKADLAQFMDGARNLTVTNGESPNSDWMFEYLSKLCLNVSRLTGSGRGETVYWEEER
ncbi:LH1 [Snake adenovirus 1]|uniref:Protein LH1 n=1 Tax=Snake adenovirus serotype 1 TaxID=189830 RepID=LH1_ADES1|nr:LH1 [Snake adenovirus 1]A9CB83.1 RecName: Full=Protein LH1 [Snake adenovirus 1]ABA47233.1 LH1 [Snake adenovirus 1]